MSRKERSDKGKSRGKYNTTAKKENPEKNKKEVEGNKRQTRKKYPRSRPSGFRG